MKTNTALRTETVIRPRGVERLIVGKATSDGAGVKLTRVLTQPLQRRLDPFLMLDAFDLKNTKEEVERAFMQIRFGTFIGDGNY